jgi:hypothetical protein
LIAAALLLAGCAVYVYREVISDFIAEIYDDHIEIFHGERNENSNPIEKIYLLHYVPEGYKLKMEISNPSKVYYIWENEAGDMISFDQISQSGQNILLNGEFGSTKIIEHNKFKIYCREFGDSCYYIWSDGTYFLTIFASGNLGLDEIIRIIDNLKIK